MTLAGVSERNLFVGSGPRLLIFGRRLEELGKFTRGFLSPHSMSVGGAGWLSRRTCGGRRLGSFPFTCVWPAIPYVRLSALFIRICASGGCLFRRISKYPRPESRRCFFLLRIGSPYYLERSGTVESIGIKREAEL